MCGCVYLESSCILARIRISLIFPSMPSYLHIHTCAYSLYETTIKYIFIYILKSKSERQTKIYKCLISPIISHCHFSSVLSMYWNLRGLFHNSIFPRCREHGSFMVLGYNLQLVLGNTHCFLSCQRTFVLAMSFLATFMAYNIDSGGVIKGIPMQGLMKRKPLG